jgi:hypothetical protein
MESGVSEHTAYCPTCRDEALISTSGLCVWCDTPLERSAPGRERVYSVDRRFTAAQLATCYRAYQAGKSCRQIAAIVWERLGFPSLSSCQSALHRSFSAKGWKLRTQSQVTVERNLKHGRGGRDRDEQAYRRFLRDQRGWNALQGPGRPQCKGVKLNSRGGGKGNRCQRPALADSEFCVSHDSRRELERQALLTKARRRMPKRDMVPLEPFARWLEHRRDELGSLTALAGSIGYTPTQAWRLLARQGNGAPKTTIGRALVERLLAADGTATFADVYGAASRQSDHAPLTSKDETAPPSSNLTAGNEAA